MYVSSAAPNLDEAELTKILSAAQKNNESSQITGILLHSDGNLLQLIEGPEASVHRLFNKIKNDERHTNLMVLFSHSVDQRDFPNFKMGFRSASRANLRESFPAYSEIVENRHIPEEDLKGLSRRVATFLRTFAKTTQMHR